MNDLNNLLLSGRLVANPQFREVNQNAVCKFTLAVNRRVKKNGNFEEKTVFVDVEVWDKSAKCCSEYLEKGREVRVVGFLNQSSWTTSAGEKRSHLFISAISVEFLNSKVRKNEDSLNEVVESVEDIPFSF